MVRGSEDDTAPDEGEYQRSAGLALLQTGVSVGAVSKGTEDDYDDVVTQGSEDDSAPKESTDIRAVGLA